MLPTINIVVIAIGVVIMMASALGRGYVRSRLRQSGMSLKTWSTFSEEFRNIKRYLRMAKRHRYPIWPAVLAMGSLAGLVLMFLAILW